MRVTRFQYPLEANLLEKIDLMIKRCSNTKSRQDAVLICEGSEGEGKSTMSIAVAYYVSEKTGRYFNAENVFFDLEKLIKFAQSTEEQIIIWDEPALQALSTDWANSVVKNLTRLLMTARKKRHFMIINATKFYKFNEYIMVDRALGMIHVYSRQGTQPGRFMYIRKKWLEALWRDYRFSKKRNYGKYASKHIKGSFPNILSNEYKYNVLSEFNIKLYESNKDYGIMMIGNESNKKDKKDLEIEKLKNALATFEGIVSKKKAEIAGVHAGTIKRWRANAKKASNEAPVSVTERIGAPIITYGKEETPDQN